MKLLQIMFFIHHYFQHSHFVPINYFDSYFIIIELAATNLYFNFVIRSNFDFYLLLLPITGSDNYLNLNYLHEIVID